MKQQGPPVVAGPRGRGATLNPVGRFETHDVEPFDDGWGSLDQPLPPLTTTVREERARTIIARNDSPDIPFDRSINPYRGCEHGCSYCFARPSHAYLGLSPGLDFESRLVAKTNAAERLRAELSRPGYRCRPIALGSNTDPYQPIERRLRITRSLIELLERCRHPLTIVTKSALVLRDLDLLRSLAARRLVTVYLSITTLDRSLARRMEPRAATPERRVETVRALAAADVPVGVLVSPIIPAINDSELEAVLEQASAAGAGHAAYLLVRLPHELRQLFDDWLRTHYPDRRRRVASLLRSMRGGRLNDPRFGHRMRGEGPFAELLGRRFEVAMRRLGLRRTGPELDTELFRRPRDERQRSLFDSGLIGG